MKNKKNIDRIIKNYTARTAELDSILNNLTRDFCANNCPDINGNCCAKDAYKRNIPEEMLELQEQEALKNGWSGEEDNGRCKYHSSTGCKLTLYKPPICIIYFCGQLEEHIKTTYRIRGKLFMKYINSAYPCSLTADSKSTDKMISFMSKAINQGKKIIKSNKKNNRRK